MENFRTLFFPRYSEKKDDRTKSKCDSATNAETRYERYKQNFAAPDVGRLRIERISDPNS